MSNYLGSLWTDPKVDANPKTELANDIINSAITEPWLSKSNNLYIRQAWYEVLNQNKEATITSLTNSFAEDTANPSLTNINTCALAAYLAKTFRSAWKIFGGTIPPDQLIPFGINVARRVYEVRAPSALAKFGKMPADGAVVVTAGSDGKLPEVYLAISGNNVNINSKPAAGNSIGNLNESNSDVVRQIGNVSNGFVPVKTYSGQEGWVINDFVYQVDKEYWDAQAQTAVAENKPEQKQPSQPSQPAVTPGGSGNVNTPQPQQTYVTLTPTEKKPIPPKYPAYSDTEKDNSDSDKPEGLSTAAKVGIGVGIAAAVVGIVVVAVKLRKK